VSPQAIDSDSLDFHCPRFGRNFGSIDFSASTFLRQTDSLTSTLQLTSYTTSWNHVWFQSTTRIKSLILHLYPLINHYLLLSEIKMADKPPAYPQQAYPQQGYMSPPPPQQGMMYPPNNDDMYRGSPGPQGGYYPPQGPYGGPPQPGYGYGGPGPYQQQPQVIYEERRSGGGGGICAGLMAGLACCCCLDCLF
jgi:hypothetical protein